MVSQVLGEAQQRLTEQLILEAVAVAVLELMLKTSLLALVVQEL
jgi:hypothetical protein